MDFLLKAYFWACVKFASSYCTLLSTPSKKDVHFWLTPLKIHKINFCNCEFTVFFLYSSLFVICRNFGKRRLENAYIHNSPLSANCTIFANPWSPSPAPWHVYVFYGCPHIPLKLSIFKELFLKSSVLYHFEITAIISKIMLN